MVGGMQADTVLEKELRVFRLGFRGEIHFQKKI